MKRSLMLPRDGRGECGLGLMEAIVGTLVLLIVGSVLLHIGRIGFAIFQLNSITEGVAQELEVAREQARTRKQNVCVIFNAKQRAFGIDRDGNGTLEESEAEPLPEGVSLKEDAVVVFSRSGALAAGSKRPRIEISNSRKSRNVSVSSIGSIEID